MLRADIPFSRDDANRFLPWMVALMAAITTLMLCVSLTLSQWVATHRTGTGNTITVQLPARSDQARDPREVVVQLEQIPGIKNATLLSTSEVRSLVQPWLGDGIALDKLAVPSVIDLTMVKPGAVDIREFRTKLNNIAPGATVDTHELWVEKFAQFNRAMQVGMMLLAVCIFAALAGMMIFTARASMKLHASTVRLLHGIGADDGYIAKQFQQNGLMLALRGAVPGVALAGLLYASLGIYIASLDAPVLPSLRFTTAHFALLVLLPAICAGIAAFSVRYATLAQLKTLP